MRLRHTLLIALLVSSTVRADFPDLFNTEPIDEAQRMPAEEAAAKMRLPSGFRASVFAAEPDVQNPIAMSWDGRGRLWVAENYTYAERSQRFQLDLRDRIIILDNSTGSRFQTRTVFTDNLTMLTGLEVGHGGVWVMCPPKLIFIPDRDADDVPDGSGEVMLDGFTVAQQNYHNFANGLRFGPDGWLYGRCGGSCPGRIGPPERPIINALPSKVECGATIQGRNASKCLPVERPIRGAMIGTKLENCSLPTRSMGICGTQLRARISRGRSFWIRTGEPMS